MADLILITLLFLFALWGYKKGFIKTIVGFASTLISLFVTTFLYSPIAELIYKAGIGDFLVDLIITSDADKYIADTEITSIIITKIISFLLVILIIKILLSILVNSLNLIAKLPIIRQANSLLGLCTGILSGIIICYIIIGIIGSLSGNDFVYSLQQHIRSSYIANLMYDSNSITTLLSK